MFSAIILRFWFFLLSFCFVDIGFYRGDFVSSMELCLARNVVCFLCFGFSFWGFVSCMHCVFCTDCCFNMDLVFDRGMMMMGRMFHNIYACLVVSFFPNSGLPDVIWCMFWLCYSQALSWPIGCYLGRVKGITLICEEINSCEKYHRCKIQQEASKEAINR